MGSLAEPEQGATLIVRVASLEDSNDFPLMLQGPGIEDRQALSVTGLNREWLTERTRWNRNFPMGVDLILVDDTQSWPCRARPGSAEEPTDGLCCNQGWRKSIDGAADAWKHSEPVARPRVLSPYL